MQAKKSRPFQVRLRAKRVVLPLERSSSHALVGGTLEGQPARLLLDTGASEVIVTPAFARRLGLALEPDTIPVEGIVGTVQARAGVVASLELGALRLENVPVLVTSLPDATACDVIVGFPLFQQLAVSLDFVGERVTLAHTGQLSPSHEALALALRFDDHTKIPSLSGVFEGAPGWFSIDTGSSETLSLDPAFLTQHRLNVQERPSQESFMAGIDGIQKRRRVRAHSLILGTPSQGLSVGQPIVQFPSVTASSTRAGNLGLGILRRFICTFDYPKKRLYLTKTPRSDAPYPHNRSGITLFGLGASVFVRTVAPESPATEQGIMVGDELLVVDRFLLLPSNQSYFYERAQQEAGTPLRLIVRRKSTGTLREVTLSLRDML